MSSEKPRTRPLPRTTTADAPASERAAARASSAPSFAADGVAEAALRARAHGTQETRCDACDGPLPEEPAGRGLYLWTRGDDVRLEEPALCASCATAIGLTALAGWDIEEEEG